MANYYGSTRTNYFHVKNEKALRDLIKNLVCYDGKIELWDDRKDEHGNPLFGFGGYCTIGGYCSETDEDEYADPDYDEFIMRLSECVADDDAVIIFEVGQEKLRYFRAYATIVTSARTETVDLTSEALCQARKMLKNPDWKTACEY